MAEWVRNSLRCSPMAVSAEKMRGTVVCSSLTESWCIPASTRCDWMPGISVSGARIEAPASSIGVHDRELHDVVSTNRRDQPLRRAQRDHAAMIHDGHAIAQPLGLIHVVGGEDDGAARLLQPIHQGPTDGGAPADPGRWSAHQGTEARDRRPARRPWPAAASGLPRVSPRVHCVFLQAARCEPTPQPQRPCERSCETGAMFPRPSACRETASPAAGFRCAGAALSPVLPIPSEQSDGSRIGLVSPSQISIVVVFPAPFGPSRPKHSPRITSRSRLSTAITSPKVLRKPFSEREGPV